MYVNFGVCPPGTDATIVQPRTALHGAKRAIFSRQVHNAISSIWHGQFSAHPVNLDMRQTCSEHAEAREAYSIMDLWLIFAVIGKT